MKCFWYWDRGGGEEGFGRNEEEKLGARVQTCQQRFVVFFFSCGEVQEHRMILLGKRQRDVVSGEACLPMYRRELRSIFDGR